MKTWPVQTGNFPNVLTRLGVSAPDVAFNLVDQVVPVSLVDSDIVLTQVSVSPLFGTPASAGELVAPAANTRLADTGQLSAGAWSFACHFTATENNSSMRLRRRNAADAADVWSMRFGIPGLGYTWQFNIRLVMLNNERLVIENAGAGTAGQTYQAVIFAASG